MIPSDIDLFDEDLEDEDDELEPFIFLVKASC